MNRIVCLINLLLFLGHTQVTMLAQVKPTIDFTEDDGLPSNIVKDLALDSYGILWIATENGIAKFDGDRFINITDNSGLQLKRAWSVECGGGNEIYAGLFEQGLAIIINDTVKEIIPFPNKQKNIIRKLFYSRFYDRLIIGTDNGLFVLEDSVLINIPVQTVEPDKKVVSEITGRDSLIFFSVADEGIYRLHLNLSDLGKAYSENIIFREGGYSCILVGDTLYGGLYNRISRYNPYDPHVQYHKSEINTSMFIWRYSQYENDRILIGGFGEGRFIGNIVIYDPKKNVASPLPIEQNNESVNSILCDSLSNIIWIARDNGLTALFKSPFEYFEIGSDKTILDIGFAGDSLLILTDKGIFHQSNSKVVTILSKDQVMSRINYWFNKYTQDPKKIPYLVFDHAHFTGLDSFQECWGKLFVSTQRGAISVPDMKSYLPLAAGIIGTINSKSIYSYINYSPLRFYPSIKDSLAWTVLSGPGGEVLDITDIKESKGVMYCLSPSKGVYAINNNEVFRLSEENSDIDQFLTGIDIDKEGNIWCSSTNCFLYNIVFSDSLLIKREINLSLAGLQGNTCKWIKFNGAYLLIGTNKGLNVISYENLNSDQPAIDYFYNSYNGYNYISAGSPVYDGKDKIYLQTSHEVISIDTSFYSRSPEYLNIKNLLINGASESPAWLENRILRYNQKQVSFLFNVIKYPVSGNLRYRYRINEGNWITGNQVVLQSLRPGNYRISLEGSNIENRSAFVKTLQFAVRPPFWYSGWFIITCLIVLLSFVSLFVKLRIKLVRSQHEEKSRLIISNSELQLRSLQIQMNPHFIFNALTAIQSFIINKNTGESLKYLGELASIIRTNLENASEEYINLTSEIEFLQKYVDIERIRFNNKLQVYFNNDVGDSSIMIPPMLIQPLIENAIKHGIRRKSGKGIIKVDFNLTGDELSVIVEDNGVGREAAKKSDNSGHNGKGLKIINQRLNLLNAMYHTDKHKITIYDLFDKDTPSGTQVVINLLVKRLK